jgi:cytochrome b
VNVTLVAIALHVAAAIYESVNHRENLIRSMITGYKRR